MRKKKKGQHGGRRAGAGRKPKGAVAGEHHGVRPFVADRHPVHVTLQITPELARLPPRSAYEAWRHPLTKLLARGDFRVIHISIQATQVHLICEADDRMALSNGVRALQISAAARLNVAIGDELGTGRRKGRVFADRYHATVIETAGQLRDVLAAVQFEWPPGHQPLPVSYASTWLLTEGWRRWGPDALDES